MTYSQLSHNAREIVARFTLATTQEVQAGRDWYPNALRICHSISKRYDVPASTVAGVISAISPQNEWSRNIIDAEAMCKLHQSKATRKDLKRLKVCTFTKNKMLAIAILTLPAITADALITGDKRLEFYNCIYRPHLNDVCIDGHAYSIWLGSRVTTNNAPPIGKKLRKQIKQDYRDATSFLNEELNETFTAADIQAITWVTHKRIHNVLRGYYKV
tara:strand:- start:376 stop:1023 length:648 start_codon:yes stop_codon:yes gene_type:complete